MSVMAGPITDGLHAKTRRDGAAGLFDELARTADPAGRVRLEEELVGLHLRLCDQVAARYAGRGIPYEDLVQVARVGLLVSIRRYRPTPGSVFIRFAVPTVTGEVKRYFRDHGWMIRPPRRLQELGPLARAAQQRWEQRHGRPASLPVLAGELQVSVAQLTECLLAQRNYQPVSLEQPLPAAGEQAVTIGERLPVLDRQLEMVVDRVALHAALARLGPADRDLVLMRFVQQLTQKQIGERLGVSQMQACRLIAAVLGRLRSLMGITPAARAV